MTAIGVEDNLNGNKALLWKLNSTGRAYIWTLEADWTKGSTTNIYDDNSNDFHSTEQFFQVDIDEDSYLGTPALIAIENDGSVGLFRDAQGFLYADNDPITNSNGQPVNYNTYIGYGMTALSVENDFDGSNVMLWELAANDRAYIWTFDASWSRGPASYAFNNGSSDYLRLISHMS